MRSLKIGIVLLGAVELANAATITLTASVFGSVPDNNVGGLVLDLNTADGRTVTGVEFFLTNFSHTWIGDLVITLEHVGTAGPITIISRLGSSSNVIAACGATFGCSSNLITGGTYAFATTGTAFSAVPSINNTSTNIPFATYASANSLGALNGAAASGTWRLNISDQAGGDVSGNAWTWGVNLTVEDSAVPEPSTLSMLGLALTGIAFRFRRRTL